MALLYTGIDRQGNIRKGKIEAPDQSTAYRLLVSQGIRPIKIEKEKSIWSRELIKRKPSDEDLSFALLQLSLLLSSGLNLTKALEVLAHQVEDKKISSAIASIKEAIERGEPLYLAFKRVEIFPEFLVEMLKTAERGENLEEIFAIAGNFLQRISDIRSRIFSSLTYPAFVIVLSILSVLVVIKFVVPKIATVLASFGRDLPLITKILLFISKMIGYLFYLLPALVVLMVFGKRFVRKEKLHEIYLKVPVFGKVSYYFNLSRFAGSLRMSIASGIPLTKALSLSRGSITNSYMRNSLNNIEEELAKGKSLSEVLTRTDLFPPLFVNLISTGEKSGELERMLSLIEELYDREAMRTISFWIRFAEPLSMLIIGIIVAFVVFSVILPITELSAGIKR
ncbi:MAG: type II secretion system F family protein [Hydrogenobacter thermophilus]|uniref:type II secretion system F family protein n=1 Tax=Hydrogenobacter thermophilus TaxID=940 RepID=UPI001C77CC70|nr:type II secretion system F family protein [Hydrogenobacter thermophilus]QWK20256.1 MAG: type II secretion system F family protein [Hydrogenobacter thermophilus]